MTLRASTILTVPLLAMLVWSLFSGLNMQRPALDRAAADLSDFTLHENALHRDLLSARAGLLRNFDPVNQAVALLDADLSHLRTTGIVDDIAGELALLASRQEDLCRAVQVPERPAAEWAGLLQPVQRSSADAGHIRDSDTGCKQPVRGHAPNDPRYLSRRGGGGRPPTCGLGGATGSARNRRMRWPH